MRCVLLLAFAALAAAVRRPNIVLILTDDQDYELGSLKCMPKLKKLMTEQGTSFRNMFVTTPICCPSRSSIVTGQYVHNTRSTQNNVEHGCSSRWFQQNKEGESMFVALKGAGYRTFYAGKYLNQYGKSNTGGPQHVPPGIDWWFGLIGDNYFYNYTASRNGTKVFHGDKTDDYFTSVIHKHAMDFLQYADKWQPFFMMITPTAPHGPAYSIPPYTHNFTDLNAPRTPAFNHHSTDKHWLMRNGVTSLSEQAIDAIDGLFRRRWRSLQSVDDLVEAVVNRVDDLGLLEDTYFLYSADNGFHLGQFGFPWDKRLPYEFDVRVPLIVRGPGVHKWVVRGEPVLNIDLAPTIVDIAGLEPLRHADGQSFLPLLSAMYTQHSFRTEFLIEYWGEVSAVVFGTLIDAPNNTYSCLRSINPNDNGEIYCEFKDNEHFVEFYNIGKDQFQLKNSVDSLTKDKRKDLMRKLAKLRKCQGQVCRQSNPNYTEGLK